MSMDRPPPKVSKELANAARDDWMREVQDAAKHRAVRQMEGYDGFKNMVSVAHLRPYHAPNLKDHSGPAPPAFAFTPEGTRAGPAPTPGASSLAPNLSGSRRAPPPARQPMAFDRAWRRSCKTSERRWEYLVRVMSPESFADVFAVEVRACTSRRSSRRSRKASNVPRIEPRTPRASHPPSNTSPARGDSNSPDDSCPRRRRRRWRDF